MITDADVEVISGRMRSWGEVLGTLAEPKLCRTMLEAIDLGDGDRFHELIGQFEFFAERSCVEISEVITKFATFGDGTLTEVCEVVHALRPHVLSHTNGRGYALPDGTIRWLSEADWWAMLDRAAGDEAWRQANHDLLIAVGIMHCHLERTDTIQRIDITKTYTICPPTWDPRASVKPA